MIPPSMDPEKTDFKWLGFLAMQETASICPSIEPTNGLANIYKMKKKFKERGKKQYKFEYYVVLHMYLMKFDIWQSSMGFATSN